jgi:hypothetical protein
VSLESTIGVLDSQVSFQQSIQLERAAVDVPHASVDLVEADVCTSTGDRDVHPLAIPPNAPIGADVAYLEAVGVFKRRRKRSHTVERAGQGQVAGRFARSASSFLAPPAA